MNGDGVLRCAGQDAYGPCQDTVQYPPGMKLFRVRTLVKSAGWSYRGTAYGWAWFCPVHDPNKEG